MRIPSRPRARGRPARSRALARAGERGSRFAADESARRATRLGSPAAHRRAATPWVVTGRDLSVPRPPRRRWRAHPASVACVLAGAVCAGLMLVALRMDGIRLRYELADAVRAEQSLLEQQRRLTVELRHLRHPQRLEELGRELGLASASCVIDLAAPAPCPAERPMPRLVAASRETAR
jgi:hypothetical protein